jgi:ubiquinone/menaquinone biosynthesis C-methylase UbiE
MNRYNLCSGQRPFSAPFINVDSQAKWNPDVVADCSHMPMFEDASADMIVIHHGLEHFGCGEADAMLKECYRILAPDGSLIVCVPHMRALAQRWLARQMDDQIYFTNLYGAYMGEEADRHRWGFSEVSLFETLAVCPWMRIRKFDWREIPGADIAKDFWILGMEAIK